MRGAGIVQVTQPAKGHRFTLDSILLADFCSIKSKDRVLEPGAGTGIISLLLAKKHPRSLLYPVEIQDELHTLCEKNRKANGLTNVISVRRDIRKLYQSINPGHFDVIVTNPPYVRTGSGRPSPQAGRSIARQDLLARIGFWLDLQKFLKQGGRCYLVFPAARLAELCSLMVSKRLEPKRLRLVHPFAGKPASLALIEAVRDGGAGLTVLAPLIVHEPDGRYTKEVQEIYGG